MGSYVGSLPVRRVKMFHEDNTRLRYLPRDEYERLIDAVKQVSTSPYLVEKIGGTYLRRGSLFNLRWDQIDFANRVMRIPRTKSGRPLSVPLNQTALAMLQQLHKDRNPTSPWVFPHKVGPNAGEPVFDIKNVREVEKGLAQMESGDTLSHEDVAARLDKLGEGKRSGLRCSAARIAAFRRQPQWRSSIS